MNPYFVFWLVLFVEFPWKGRLLILLLLHLDLSVPGGEQWGGGGGRGVQWFLMRSNIYNSFNDPLVTFSPSLPEFFLVLLFFLLLVLLYPTLHLHHQYHHSWAFLLSILTVSQRNVFPDKKMMETYSFTSWIKGYKCRHDIEHRSYGMQQCRK